jgi:methionyl-tRNA synthetase
MKNKFITTAIAYANGNPHLGHAYEFVLTDAISRFHKVWKKQNTFFMTGMDEHGQKIFEKAKSENIDVHEFVNKYAKVFQDLDKKLDVDYDLFIRTTNPEHYEVCKKLWMKIHDAGDLYQKEYVGMYCVGCEGFKTEKDLNENGECPDHLKKPIELKEKNWFFKLSKYGDFLKEKIESDELKIVPSYRKNEMLEFISNGLQDISFSRSKELMSWGIPVPNDDTQVMYVWADALTNYITGAKVFGKDEADEKNFQEFWTDGETLHVIGKDILRFHSLYWPAMLQSAGLAIPKEILVHGFITSQGQKMSKSLGNVVLPDEILNLYEGVGQDKSILGDKFSLEVFRYFFLKNINPHDDGDFTFSRMKELYNADLANGLGNLVNRTVKLCEKYLPLLTSPYKGEELEQNHKEFCNAMHDYDVMNAMNYIWRKINDADLYMQTNEPFKVVKVDLEAGKKHLEFLRGEVFTIARLLEPFMPTTSETIKKIILENKMPEKPLFPRYE